MTTMQIVIFVAAMIALFNTCLGCVLFLWTDYSVMRNEQLQKRLLKDALYGDEDDFDEAVNDAINLDKS